MSVLITLYPAVYDGEFVVCLPMRPLRRYLEVANSLAACEAVLNDACAEARAESRSAISALFPDRIGPDREGKPYVKVSLQWQEGRKPNGFKNQRWHRDVEAEGV